jgi:hypothetical protein
MAGFLLELPKRARLGESMGCVYCFGAGSLVDFSFLG